MKTNLHPFIRRFACLLLALCLPLSVAAAEQEISRGFETQEACAEAVFEALRSGDAEAFLACYAIDEMARNFDLATFFEKFGGLMLRDSLLQPSGAWSVARNKAKLENDLLYALASSIILFSNPDAKNDVLFNFITKKDYTPEQVVSLTDTGDPLSRLEFQGLIDPESLYTEYAEVFEKQRWRQDAYGMKEWREKVLAMKLDGRMVYMALGFVRYDDGWLLTPNSSIIAAAMNVPANLLMISEDYFTR